MNRKKLVNKETQRAGKHYVCAICDVIVTIKCGVISDKHPTSSNLSESSIVYNIKKLDGLAAVKI